MPGDGVSFYLCAMYDAGTRRVSVMRHKYSETDNEVIFFSDSIPTGFLDIERNNCFLNTIVI